MNNPETRTGLGQVGHRAGQVAVGVGVRQEAADAGDDLAEVEAVPPPQHRVGRLGHLEQRDATPRPHHPGQLVEERRQVSQVAQREPTGGPVGGGVGHGEAQHVALHQGGVGAGGGQHPVGEIDADGVVAGGAQLPAQVARAAGQVEHHRSLGQAQLPHRAATPADIETERHDPVDQVVAGRDGVEHRADHPDLLVPGRQVVVRRHQVMVRTVGGHRRHPPARRTGDAPPRPGSAAALVS